MYPYIEVGAAILPTFSLCAAIGIIAMFALVLLRLRSVAHFGDEAAYIVPKLFIALGAAFLGAIFFDALFKIPENGGLKLAGMTFYGGLIVGAAVFVIEVATCRKNTSLTPWEWTDIVVIPLVVFHFFGRIGCFLGGCCYGRETTSFWGVVFPDDERAGVVHGGAAVYPTQLFEAAGLAVIALLLVFVKRHRLPVYGLAYSALRFGIEFLRGDNRGSYLGPLSPAQVISIAVFAVSLFTLAFATRLRDNEYLTIIRGLVAMTGTFVVLLLYELLIEPVYLVKRGVKALFSRRKK